MNDIKFEDVFKIWMDAETNPIVYKKLEALSQSKGFSSLQEYRMEVARRFGMDKKQWRLEEVIDPQNSLPKIIIGPFPGWSHQQGITFYQNKLTTTFADALEIPEFQKWCSQHDRIIPLTKNFPLPTSIIVFRKPNGELIHIEGGHRICAVAYASKIGEPISFIGKPSVTMAIADITDDEVIALLPYAQKPVVKE